MTGSVCGFAGFLKNFRKLAGWRQTYLRVLLLVCCDERESRDTHRRLVVEADGSVPWTFVFFVLKSEDIAISLFLLARELILLPSCIVLLFYVLFKRMYTFFFVLVKCDLQMRNLFLSCSDALACEVDSLGFLYAPPPPLLCHFLMPFRKKWSINKSKTSFISQGAFSVVSDQMAILNYFFKD